MTGLFMPAVFRAEGGQVLFEGRPVPQIRAIAIREHLNAKALDRSTTQRCADVHWTICNQLRGAMTEARRHREAEAQSRRASFTTITSRKTA